MLRRQNAVGEKGRDTLQHSAQWGRQCRPRYDYLCQNAHPTGRLRQHLSARVNIGTVNSSPPGQNGRQFADETFSCISVNEKFCIWIKISLECVPKGPINNIPALVQIMAWRLLGDKPLSEPMLTQFRGR